MVGKSSLLAALAIASLISCAQAQSQPSVKELLDRAQSEADKRAVEDLIGKLKSRPGASQPKSPDAAPPSAAETPPSPSPISRPATPDAGRPPVASTEQPPAAASPPGAPSAPPSGQQPAPIPVPPAVVAQPPPASPPSGQLPPTVSAPPQVTPPIARAPEIAERLALPSVDFEVNFEVDSARITPRAGQQLITLGKALADPRLADTKFVIGGHTDASGPADYNVRLSHHRAEAVRAFLIAHFNARPDNLIARGFGAQALKNKANPYASENRRVQVINWAGVASSETSK